MNLDPMNWTFHSDPGHGWLEVARADLEALGLLSSISHYSYQRGERVYLEEDCDATKFYAKLALLGWTPDKVRQVVTEWHPDQAACKRFDRYQAPPSNGDPFPMRDAVDALRARGWIG